MPFLGTTKWHHTVFTGTKNGTTMSSLAIKMAPQSFPGTTKWHHNVHLHYMSFVTPTVW